MSLPFLHPILLPTPLGSVGIKVLTFYDKMNRIAEFLQEHDAPEDLQIDRDNLFLEFYIDKPGMVALANIASQEGFTQMGVFFGLQNPEDQKPLIDDEAIFGELTGCFVGLDKDRKVLACHFPDPTNKSGKKDDRIVEAEDTWPPPPPKPHSPTAIMQPGQEEEYVAPPRYFSLSSYVRSIIDYFFPDLEDKRAKE